MRFSVHHQVQPIVRDAEVRAVAQNNLKIRVLITAGETPSANANPMHKAVLLNMPYFLPEGTPEREQSEEQGGSQPSRSTPFRGNSPMNHGPPARQCREHGSTGNEIGASRR